MEQYLYLRKVCFYNRKRFKTLGSCFTSLKRFAGSKTVPLDKVQFKLQPIPLTKGERYISGGMEAEQKNLVIEQYSCKTR